MNNSHSVLSIIESGHVKRCHTTPGDGYQTTGHHSFEVAILLEYIMPTCTKAALMRALTHDSAEKAVGDVPGHAKWASPELTSALAVLEDKFDKAHGIDYDLCPEEEMAVKMADILSLLIYANHQVHMGNQYFAVYIRRIQEWFAGHHDHVKAFPKAKEFITYVTN